MGISPHEQQQFESLVSNFDVEDTGLVKAMERRAKATEMTFTPLPHLPAFRAFLFYALILMAFACSPASFLLVKNDMAMALLILMLAPISICLAYKVKPKSWSR